MVVGGGAREHSLVWKLIQSPKTEKVYVTPGNAGTGMIAHNLGLPATDIEALAQAAQQYNIDLTVVGPEAPLAFLRLAAYYIALRIDYPHQQKPPARTQR